jgi:hypothetical protein
MRLSIERLEEQYLQLEEGRKAEDAQAHRVSLAIIDQEAKLLGVHIRSMSTLMVRSRTSSLAWIWTSYDPRFTITRLVALRAATGPALFVVDHRPELLDRRTSQMLGVIDEAAWAAVDHDERRRGVQIADRSDPVSDAVDQHLGLGHRRSMTR